VIDNDGYHRVILDLSRRLRDDILAEREVSDGLDAHGKQSLQLRPAFV